MAPDLLSTIAGEIEARLAELRPLNAEYEQLLVAAAALDSEQAASSPPRRAAGKPRRSARGAAREAILAALDHGSHTLAELALVTAMKTPNINGNLRRLLAEGVVEKTEREGKTAYALPGQS